jgi:hypothetical protein
MVEGGSYTNGRGLVRRIDRIDGMTVHWSTVAPEAEVGKTGQSKISIFQKWATQQVGTPG